MTIHDSKKSAVSRRWTAALLAAAAAAGLTGAVSAAGPQQEDELWWLTGGSGEHSQADPAAKNPVQLSAPDGDEETPADPEEPGEAYDGPSTVHNEEGFFVKQEDETGHGTWNSLTEKGLWVGGDGDDTGFRVDNDGNVATTGNADIDGTLSASNDKFTVDEKGNLHAKNENARIDLDEAGAYLQSNTTYMGVTDGTATIASGASRVQVTEDGAVFETPDGKTSIKGNAVETGKATAEKGDIGGVWMADRNVSNVDKITAAGGQFIVDEAGKVTASKGDIGGVWMADRNVSNVDKITAEKGDIGNVYLKDGTISAAGGQFIVDETGKVTASKGDVGGVWMADRNVSNVDKITAEKGDIGDVYLKDGTITAAGGQFTVDETGKVTAEKGDVGDVWMADGNVTAASIQNRDGSFKADADGNVTAASGAFSGSVTAENGTIGGVTMADGGISAANNQFYVNGETGVIGDVTMTGGGITVADELETLNGTAVKAGEDGSINGVFLNDGKIGTVNGNFHVDEDGSITAAGAGTIGGVSLSNGTVAAQDVTITLAANGREAETVSMSDMWDAMSGGTMTVDGISYGGSYFYTSGTNTPRLSIGGGRYNVNMNHFGQIMDAVEGVGVDTVTDAIDGLKKDEAGSGTASGTSAAANEAVTASADGAEAAPAAKEARAKLAAASFVLTPDVTPSLLSEETEGSGQTGTDADPDREPPMTGEGGSGTEGGNAGQTLDLPNDHGSLGGLTITGNRPDENGNSFAVTGKSQFDGDSQFNGDVAIGNSDTDYSLKLNGEDVATENHVDHQITNAIGNRFEELGSEIDSVGAISAALAGLHPLDYDGTGSKFQLSAAIGSYDGTQAAAVGGFYHFNEDVMMSVGGATAFEGDHKTAANIGVTFRVGQGSSGKRLSSDAVMAQLEEMNRKIQAMDEKINSLEQKNQDLEAENKELKAEA